MNYLDLNHVVELSRNLYAINSEVADLYNEAMTGNKPCGYAWTDIQETSSGFKFSDVLWAKEGQALTGDVKTRIKKFETIFPQLIVDVLIDEFFNEEHKDKKLISYRLKNEDNITPLQGRTIEGLIYNSADIFDEIRIRRRDALAALTSNTLAGTRITSLHTKQFRIAAQAVKMFGLNGARSIIASLCARFGKTLWSGAIAYHLNMPVVVVASYVLTSFHSFRNQWASSRQLKQEFVQIDTDKPDWKDKFIEARKAGKRVVLFLSLCPGNNRQDRIDYIGDIDCQKLWIIDEGDYGAHTSGQVNAMHKGIADSDYMIIMTGTNADRAVENWSTLRQFYPVSCVYEELLVQKRETKSGKVFSPLDEFEADLLTSFAIDSSIDLNIPNRATIIMDMSALVEKQKQLLLANKASGEWDPLDYVNGPSWAKTSKFPAKAQPFLIDFWKATDGALSGFEHLNIDMCIELNSLPPRVRYTGKTGQSILVEQHFFSATNDNLDKIGESAKRGRPGWRVEVTTGKNGYKNELYESKVEAVAEECSLTGQNLLIISNRQGQRSFGFGALSTVGLNYDGGDHGTTIQKESRHSTMSDDYDDKTGYTLISSFNPNREVKPFVGAITAVKNLAPQYPNMSAKDLLKYILPTLNIFEVGSNGELFQVEPNSTVDRLFSNGLIKQILGATQNIGSLSTTSRLAWLKATGYKPPTHTEEEADVGKTYNDNKPKKPKKAKNLKKDKTYEQIEKEENARIKQAMTLLFDKFHILQIGTGCRTVESILDTIQKDSDHREFFAETFNIDIDVILQDIKDGAIHTKSLEMSLT